MLRKKSKIFLSAFLVAAIAMSIAYGLSLNNQHAVQSSPSQMYRYVVKFEDEESAEAGIPILTYTHINVYNPNSLNVSLTKQFVQALPETSAVYGNTTGKVTFVVPNGTAFEIDASDVGSWPQSPVWPLKGFVIIDSPSELNVTAVYSRTSYDGDIANKIAFTLCTPPSVVYTPDQFLFDVPQEVVVDAPDPNSPVSVKDLLVKAGVNDNYVKLGMFEIISISSYFDLAASPTCRARDKIVFKVPDPNKNAPSQDPNDFWANNGGGANKPSWWNKVGNAQPASKLDVVVKTSLNSINDPTEQVKGALVNELVNLGTPLANAQNIVNKLKITILEVSVAEGIGLTTSMDVEIIPPAIITGS